jgi:hypothetical protein
MRILKSLVACLAIALVGAGGVADPDPGGWPRVFEEDGLTFTIYQPQLEKWDGVRVLAHAAVSVATPASPLETYGVVWIAARAAVDKEEHLVTFDDVKFARASFPSAPERTDEWLAALRRHEPSGVRTMELARLEASFAAMTAGEKASHAPLRNDPPRILFSARPAVLVLVDGTPVERRVPGTDLLRVVNTRALLLRDEKASRYFLSVSDRWLEAPSLDGPWALARSIPAGAAAAKETATAEKQVDLSQDAEVARLLAAGEVPLVVVSTGPAELIETSGEPALVPVPGTNLLWVRNTNADVFVDAATNETYVLVSGRWFRAPSRAGPWTFVASRDLPPDFARIPETHPAGEVLSSIAGTPQAQEAAIANTIPQTASVSRADARLDVTYDGSPRLVPIEGTTLRYAVNTRTPVVQVGDLYYACENGVWFVSASPLGPWTLATALPPAIYAIPPSCPIHYVTYVRIYDVTPGYVFCGYTPGYLGTCVALDGCVVWGTGFWYRPWVGAFWFGCPWTYGFGVGIHWGAASGWCVGLGLGAWPPCWPWWGPLGFWRPGFYPAYRGEPHVEVKVNNVNVYNHWRAGVVRSTPRAGPSRAGSSARGRNDVYSAPDGRVYRHTNEGWENRQGGTWQRDGASGRAQLDAEHRAREQGNLRVETLNRGSEPRSTEAPQRSGPQAAPRPAPVPPGLRGGPVRVRRGR